MESIIIECQHNAKMAVLIYCLFKHKCVILYIAITHDIKKFLFKKQYLKLGGIYIGKN